MKSSCRGWTSAVVFARMVHRRVCDARSAVRALPPSVPTGENRRWAARHKHATLRRRGYRWIGPRHDELVRLEVPRHSVPREADDLIRDLRASLHEHARAVRLREDEHTVAPTVLQNDVTMPSWCPPCGAMQSCRVASFAL